VTPETSILVVWGRYTDRNGNLLGEAAPGLERTSAPFRRD
jgi:hypothetical protein